MQSQYQQAFMPPPMPDEGQPFADNFFFKPDDLLRLEDWELTQLHALFVAIAADWKYFIFKCKVERHQGVVLVTLLLYHNPAALSPQQSPNQWWRVLVNLSQGSNLAQAWASKAFVMHGFPGTQYGLTWEPVEPVQQQLEQLKLED
jgi:hypothetical protein